MKKEINEIEEMTYFPFRGHQGLLTSVIKQVEVLLEEK